MHVHNIVCVDTLFYNVIDIHVSNTFKYHQSISVTRGYYCTYSILFPTFHNLPALQRSLRKRCDAGGSRGSEDTSQGPRDWAISWPLDGCGPCGQRCMEKQWKHNDSGCAIHCQSKPFDHESLLSSWINMVSSPNTCASCAHHCEASRCTAHAAGNSYAPW